MGKDLNQRGEVYVIGDSHTNSVEGFWSLIKRGIGGACQSEIFVELLG